MTVQTYHAFCMEKAHGRLLSGKPVRFLYPGDERLQKSSFDGDWNLERQRQAAESGLHCFDLFAAGTVELLERCAALRELIADRFPMIIVDEFRTRTTISGGDRTGAVGRHERFLSRRS